LLWAGVSAAFQLDSLRVGGFDYYVYFFNIYFLICRQIWKENNIDLQQRSGGFGGNIDGQRKNNRMVFCLHRWPICDWTEFR
jgi:hypothetical protein